MKLLNCAVIICVLCMLLSCQMSTKERREIASNLTYDEVEEWLEENKVAVPEDLRNNIDINQYVLNVIQQVQEGRDTSGQVSYTVTRNFIKAIQKAAGYKFDSLGEPIS